MNSVEGYETTVPAYSLEKKRESRIDFQAVESEYIDMKNAEVKANNPALGQAADDFKNNLKTVLDQYSNLVDPSCRRYVLCGCFKALSTHRGCGGSRISQIGASSPKTGVKKHWQIQGEMPGTRPPGSKFFHFYAVFSEKFAK